MAKEVDRQFSECRKSLHDSSMVTQLYYCGTLTKPERRHHIIDTGFSDKGTYLGSPIVKHGIWHIIHNLYVSIILVF